MQCHRPGWMPLCLALIVITGRILSAEEQPSAPPLPAFKSGIGADQLRPHVEYLASPSLAGRSGVAKDQARKYIIEQWQAVNLRPLFSTSPANREDRRSARQNVADALAPSVLTYEQPIPGAADAEGIVPIEGCNVGAWLPGSDPNLVDEIIVIGAHYDHLGTRDGRVFAGADDNASGIAMLIEAARRLASDKTPPRRPVAFVGFDLEERMLWGSRWFAADPPWPIKRVKLFITADMIGRSLGDLPLPAVFVMGSERAVELKTALDVVGTPPGLEVCRLGTDIVGTRSDYGPFRDREIPYLFFSTGEHPDYHTPRDTADKIDYEKAARIASLILNVARYTADADVAPVWTDTAEMSMQEPRVLLRIATLLLEADKQRPLTQVQKFFVTNVRNRAQMIVDSEKMTADDRVWLVRMSQLLLLSVF